MNHFKDRYILTVNCGSSSLKFSLYHHCSMRMEVMGHVDDIDTSNATLLIVNRRKEVLETKEFTQLSFPNAEIKVIEWLKNNEPVYPLIAIGFRIVMGGPDHFMPEVLTKELFNTLKQLVYLAPNHLPTELGTIQAFKESFPSIPQIACYDTFFHHTMPSYSKYYPLPQAYITQGLMRYGFHGISYESIMKKLSQRKLLGHDKKIIIAHLGSGSSIVAIKHDKSVDTSMGISPLGGLVMGSRPGDLDPGVILFLLNQCQLSTNDLENLLSKGSGLRAISGSSNVQELLKREKKDPKAEEALTVFCYHIKKFIGAYAAAMGGLDILVFTGGIGGNSAPIRERVCTDMEFLGIKLANPKNTSSVDVISEDNSKVTLLALQTNEELIIAEHTYALLKNTL